MTFHPTKNLTSLKPNKLLGQNFLTDKKALAQIIAAADLSSQDLVLEVGPGQGVLTKELAQQAGRVVAVEKDARLVEILKKDFANIQTVEIIEGDILKKLKTNSLNLPIDYKVVANIPYYLTSHLIRLLLENPRPPQLLVLMVQQEVGERLCASPPKMSLLGVAAQFYSKADIVARVSKKSFSPPPKVDSVIIRLIPFNRTLDLKETETFFRVVKAGFVQPRKQLINNLSNGLKIDKKEIAAALKKIGLAPEQRAESLTIEDWKKLSKLIE